MDGFSWTGTGEGFSINTEKGDAQRPFPVEVLGAEVTI